MLKETNIERDGVKVHIIQDDRQLCSAEKLTINNKPAFLYDLGISMDVEPDAAQPCGCGNRVFKMKPMTDHTMAEYELDGFDYVTLKEILQEVFSIGMCPRCRKDKEIEEMTEKPGKRGRRRKSERL